METGIIDIGLATLLTNTAEGLRSRADPVNTHRSWVWGVVCLGKAKGAECCQSVMLHGPMLERKPACD